MKKILAALICAAVCLTTGCAKSETSGTQQTSATTSNNSASSSTAVTETSAPTSTVTETSVPTSVPISSVAETSAPTSEPTAQTAYQYGTWSGDVYTSDFFGYKLHLSGWTKDDDAQIAERNGIDDISKLNDAVKKSTSDDAVYEVYAQKPDATTLVVGANRYNGRTLDEYVKSNANGLKANTNVTDVTVGEAELAGESRPCVTAKQATDSADVYVTMVFFQNGDYFDMISLASLSQSDLQPTLEALFNADSAPSGDTSAPAEATFERGKWSGDTYTSDFFGFSIDLNGYTNESDERLATRNSMTDMSDASFISEVEKGNGSRNIYDVFARTTDGNAVAVAYNKLTSATAELLVQQTKESMDEMSIYKDVHADKITMGGKTVPCVYVTLASGSVDVYEAVMVYQNGEYFAVITIGAVSQNEIQQIIGGISAVFRRMERPRRDRRDFK